MFRDVLMVNALLKIDKDCDKRIIGYDKADRLDHCNFFHILQKRIHMEFAELVVELSQV